MHLEKYNILDFVKAAKDLLAKWSNIQTEQILIEKAYHTIWWLINYDTIKPQPMISQFQTYVMKVNVNGLLEIRQKGKDGRPAGEHRS